MNNDRFDDALRRKLEEVKPVFQEKNWSQLQRFMGSRGFPPSVWHSPASWLQPALTAAAATALVITTVWQYRNNQTLNDRIETLTHTVTRLEQTQTTLQETVSAAANTPRRADTVYVVERVPVWLRATNAPNVPTQRIPADDRLTTAESHPGFRPTLPTAQLNETPVYETPAYSANIRRPATGTPAGGATPAGNVPEEEQTQLTDNQLTVQKTEAAARLQLLTPVTDLSESEAWLDSWQQHLRRVRYRSPYAAAAKPEKSRNPANIRWRLGVGGDVSTVQMRGGLFAEALINNRFTISAGIGQAVWSGDSFQTDVQFGQHTKQDFKKAYPGGAANVAGPGPFPQSRTILNISRSGTALVVPVQVGYRFEAGRGFYLSPFVGANLSFDPTEEVNYALERPYGRDLEWQNLRVNRSLSSYSSWAIGFGFERQFGPFVAQLSPVTTVPFVRPNAGLNEASLGLRARLSYQF
jgi:hypothetical protein